MHLSMRYLDDAEAYAGWKKMAVLAQLKRSTRLVFLMRSKNPTVLAQINQLRHNTKHFFLANNNTFNNNIKSFFITMDEGALSRYAILKYICYAIQREFPFGQIIVFCKVILASSIEVFLNIFFIIILMNVYVNIYIFLKQNKLQAHEVYSQLAMASFEVILHSGNLSIQQRENAMKKFKDGRGILVTTEVSCRGVEGEDVVAVINFDVQMNKENTSMNTKSYIARVGRAGRFGKNLIVHGHWQIR